MTAPNRLAVSRLEDTQLIPGTSLPIYWTGENADTGATHGAGGKTVLINGQYSAVLYVNLSGVIAGETVDVYASEEDANGNVIATGPAQRITGTGAPLWTAVPIMGAVTQRLVFRIRANGSQVVDMTVARLDMQSWPNA